MTDERVDELWRAGRHEELAARVGMGIATSIAKKMHRKLRGTEVDLEDVVSWALEAMWKAILDWDPGRGVPLRGYIAQQVRWGIAMVKRDAACQKRGEGYQRIPIEFIYRTASTALEGLDASESTHRADDDVPSDEYLPFTYSRLAHSMIEVRREEDGMWGRIELWNALAILPERQQRILRMLATDMSLREIGRELGVSYECVRIEAKKARAAMGELLG